MPSTPDTSASGTSRRAFCSGAATLLLAQGRLSRAAGFAAQMPPGPPGTATRPDVAAIDHDRVLAAAEHYLTQQPTPLTSLPCPRSLGTPHDYYSEAQPATDTDAKANAAPPPFTAHRDALFTLGLAAPALAAAHLLTGEERYAEYAAVWLRAWFIDPATRMSPSLDFGQVVPAPAPTNQFTVQTNSRSSTPPAHPGGRFEGVLETLPLVEVAQAIPFLAASLALTAGEQKALRAWFAAYLHWLTAPQDSGPRLAALARDQKSHHGTSWLLQACAYATFTAADSTAPRAEDNSLEPLRHQYKAVTLRAQITADGAFPHELPSPTPYRDSLFNLDMLALVCQLLSTRFDNVWDYQLEDGPSMRSAIAYHFPFIAERGLWPYRADIAHFDQLPSRRISLLLCARAYQRPEYAALWKTLPPDPASPDVLRTLPVHQPLLWVRQPPRT